MTTASLGNSKIEQRYLLVLFSVSVFYDEFGKTYISKAWAKDLAYHLGYLPSITVISYRETWSEDIPGLVCVTNEPYLRRARIVPVRKPTSRLRALLGIPAVARLLWREIGRADIVHSSLVAWPIPEAWYVVPIARWKGKPHLIIVESATWRPSTPNQEAGIFRNWLSASQERLAKACINQADLAIFTHDGYRQSLLSDPARGHVIEASWIESKWLVSRDQLQRLNRDKLKRHGLNFAYFGRLEEAKGVRDAITAFDELRRSGMDVSLDIFGAGSLSTEIASAFWSIGSSGESFTQNIFMRGSVDYGSPLMDVLQRYDGVVVPTRTDEQPRIIFDAFSQGVPVIATSTAGNKQCVKHGHTGLLIKANNVHSLKQAIMQIMQNKETWFAMSENCLAAARNHTHEHMHQMRVPLIKKLLERFSHRSS